MTDPTQSSDITVGTMQERDCGKLDQLDVPMLYGDVTHEFDAACNHLALVNRSMVGKIEVGGNDGLDLLHRLSTNDLLQPANNSATPTVLLTEKGRIIDYVYVVHAPSLLLLLVSSGNEATVRSWVEKYTIMEDVTLTLRTRDFSLLTLIGPKAHEAAERTFACTLRAGGLEEIVLPFASVTVSYRREFGTSFVDILVPSQHGGELWSFLLTRCDEQRITPMGTLAYEAFRISRGIPALGGEISDAFNPYEVGLREAISFTKGCYVGQEVIARLDTYQKVQREAWGILLDEGKPTPQRGAKVVQNDTEIGVLTSASSAVIRGKRCGIGILKKHHVQSDDPIGIEGEGGMIAGQCVPLPVLL